VQTAQSIRVRYEPPNPPAAEQLLRALPAWFGIESAVQEYVAAASRLPTYLARTASGEPVGVLLTEQHFPAAAEVYLMAVASTYHRAGVGRALLAAAEADLIATGVTVLHVKTLGPSHPDPGYASTRLFYEACGFQPLEEIPGLWSIDNPCLIMVRHLQRHRPGARRRLDHAAPLDAPVDH